MNKNSMYKFRKFPVIFLIIMLTGVACQNQFVIDILPKSGSFIGSYGEISEGGSEGFPLLSVEKEPDLSLTLTPLQGTLPGGEFYNERQKSFTVTVSGFTDSEEALDTGLELENLPKGLSLTGNSAEDGIITGVLPDMEKTFTLIIAYDGNEPFAEPVLVYISASGFTAAPELIAIDVIDGLETERPVPLNNANIIAFNKYTMTAGGIGRHYILAEEISLPEPAPGEDSNWIPVGGWLEIDGFKGSFDGDGHFISGLVFGLSAVNLFVPGGYLGFFGSISPGGTVKNLGLADICINNKKFEIGGIAATNYGNIENCYVTGSIISDDTNIGGIAGKNYGIIQNCYSSADITSKLNLGGIAGWNNENAIIQNCYSTGDITCTQSNSAGGITGRNDGKIYNCYALGNINGINNSLYLGGITGRNIVESGAEVVNCAALNMSIVSQFIVPASAYIGRIAGLGNPVLKNNYARGDMVLKYNGTKPLPAIVSDAEGLHGESITVSEYGEESWWKDNETWNTDDGTAWDFVSIWDWNDENHLPVLRNAGGDQDHTVN